MPSLAMLGTAKTHPLEQMNENMFGPLPRRDLKTIWKQQSTARSQTLCFYVTVVGLNLITSKRLGS